LAGKAIGWLGELHPLWQQKSDLPKSAVLFELDLEPMTRRSLSVAGEISKYPLVRRDIAVVVSESVSLKALLGSLQDGRSPIVSDISLFDVYRGKGIENGKKSLAFRVLLQDTEKTLTDAEADLAITKLMDILRSQFNAVLRN
jgi:phenylalanyl-tRNA synthetase beta chain